MPSPNTHQEIERQFRVKDLPNDIGKHPCVSIRQGYLSATEDREIRIRASDDQYTLTIKDGQGLCRGETEIPLTEQQFNSLWPATGRQRIEKLRYEYPLPSHTAQIDCYLGPLDGFNVLEVEFTSQADSENFTPPSFCSEEMTEQGSFFYLQNWLAKSIT